jgi:hypothetical protein
VLRGRFIKYTQNVATRHNLPTSPVKMGGVKFNVTRKSWEPATVALPMNPNGRPILLVPARFLQELPVLNAYDWWENYEAEQLRNDMNYEVLTKVTKKDIVAAARRNPSRVRAWANAKESIKAEPYDLSKDPAGVWRWERLAREFVESAPLTISPATDDAEFKAVIELVIRQFKLFVEQQGGWRLLWNDGNTKEKPEEAAQLLFRGVAQSYCIANDIVLDREVNLGRGPVDFKFSNGYRRRALLEVKKLHNGKFWNGLTDQLPSYLTSDDCKLGWYVPVQYRGDGVSKTWRTDLPIRVAKVARDNALELQARVIDARPKPSASKLKNGGGNA